MPVGAFFLVASQKNVSDGSVGRERVLCVVCAAFDASVVRGNLGFAV